jgi:gluconate 5-dehydrogenase
VAATGAKVHAFSFDVTDADSVTQGVADILAGVGPIDILVNSAGIQRRAPLVDFAFSDWNAIVAVNLTGAFLVAQQVSKAMIAQGGGKIVNIGSVQSQLARPGITPYAATKGAIVMLTKGLCADLAGHGIQAADVCARLHRDGPHAHARRGRTVQLLGSRAHSGGALG